MIAAIQNNLRARDEWSYNPLVNLKPFEPTKRYTAVDLDTGYPVLSSDSYKELAEAIQSLKGNGISVTILGPFRTRSQSPAHPLVGPDEP